MLAKIFSNRVLGIIFIGLMVLGVWFVNAVFSQTFIKFDDVGLKTDNAGLNLPERADVKVRGVIVGQVNSMTSDGDGAKLVLGLKPSMIKSIPKNVSATILPKTLFGEKYVALNIPSQPSSTSLKTGDQIGQTTLPTEVEKVLNDIYPLLRTIQPAELNYTLNALATALEGRGEKLGETIETLNAYLTKLNPQVPGLIADLKLLTTVSDTYADVTPEIAATLRNTVKTGRTLVSRQATLRQFLRDTTSFSGTAQQFLSDNGDNLIRLGKLTEPQAALLARYSPEFPCLLRGITDVAPKLGNTFRGFIFHIDLEVGASQLGLASPGAAGPPRGYKASETPVFGANNAPSCAHLPNTPNEYSQARPFDDIPNFNDGVNGLGRGGVDKQRPATGFDSSVTASKTASAISTGVAATADSKKVVNALVAPALGVAVDEVPDLTTMLFAPLAAGTEVSAR